MRSSGTNDFRQFYSIIGLKRSEEGKAEKGLKLCCNKYAYDRF